MKSLSKILPLLAFAGLALCSLKSSAQVTSVVNVTVTVIPAPGIDFSPVKYRDASFVTTGSSESLVPGITFRTSGNVLVCFEGEKRGRRTLFNFQQAGAKTITARELSEVKRIEIIYLGS